MKSLKGLARRLCVPLDVLQELADTIESQYRTFPMSCRGKTRIITAPSERLKSVQRRIYEELLKPLGVPDHLHGSVPGRSPYTNAAAHAAQPWLLRVDIVSFFPSVKPSHVYRLWIEQLGCSPQVARLLTKLTTFNFSLPQGAPTSTALANLILAGVDECIKRKATEGDLRFTRYVDDLGLSGENPQGLVKHVSTLLQREGFKVSRKKLAVMPRTGRQEITGYGTNSANPSIGQKYRGRIRAAIHGLSQLHPASAEFREQLLSVQGKIRHLRRTNPGPARRLEDYLRSVIRG